MGQGEGLLCRCSNYWASNGKPLTDLVVPMGYNGREPLTTLVWLTAAIPKGTGAGWSKTSGPLVDREQIAIIGVSGTVPLGKGSLAGRKTPSVISGESKPRCKKSRGGKLMSRGSVVALGLSQGSAQAGLAVATRHPEFFAGAVAICLLLTRAAAERHTRSVAGGAGFCGRLSAEEHPARVELAANNAGSREPRQRSWRSSIRGSGTLPRS